MVYRITYMYSYHVCRVLLSCNYGLWTPYALAMAGSGTSLFASGRGVGLISAGETELNCLARGAWRDQAIAMLQITRNAPSRKELLSTLFQTGGVSGKNGI